MVLLGSFDKQIPSDHFLLPGCSLLRVAPLRQSRTRPSRSPAAMRAWVAPLVATWSPEWMHCSTSASCVPQHSHPVHWKKKRSHFDIKNWVTGGSKNSTRDSGSIWLKYSTITQNPGSNFSSASDSTFKSIMTPFSFSVNTFWVQNWTEILSWWPHTTSTATMIKETSPANLSWRYFYYIATRLLVTHWVKLSLNFELLEE